MTKSCSETSGRLGLSLLIAELLISVTGTSNFGNLEALLPGLDN